MPNLVVYVPADVARVLEAKGVSEDLQRKACKEVLVGLADGLEEGVARAAAGDVVSPLDGAAAAPSSSPREPVTRSEGRSGSAGSGKCPADTPRGTRCKLCGEKH